MSSGPLVFADQNGLTIDHKSHTIRLTRYFDAPRAHVFDAWTRAERVKCWWDPAGVPLLTCEIDLRPGGSFKFVSKGHEEMPFAGTYSEVIPPDRLVFEAMGATGRVILQEEKSKTQMLVEIQCRSAEHLAQFLKIGVDKGTSQTLDNLVAYISRPDTPYARVERAR
jgi:uncharacterized protein YndB with AHSA1/START domain